MKRLIFSLLLVFLAKVYGDDDADDVKGVIRNSIEDSEEASNATMVNYDSCGQNFPNVVTRRLTNVGDTPWIALVGCEDKETENIVYACTGALINARYVLTTAQCILRKRSEHAGRISHVRLGEHNLHADRDCLQTRLHPCVTRTTPIDIEVEEAIPHPSFDKRGHLSDNIGLIRLDDTLDLTRHYGFINPICLPSPYVNPQIYFQGRMAEVVGWDFGSGHPNDILMKEFVSFANNSLCSSLYRGFESDSQICMKSTKIRRRCIGDSGSPLSLPGPNGPPFLLVGVLSFGPIPCRDSESPAVYTSVSYYRKWIDRNMRPYIYI